MRRYYAFLFLLLSAYLMNGSTSYSQEIKRVVPESQTALLYSYAPLVKKTAPSVVNIYTKRKREQRLSPFLSDPFFQFFFKDRLHGLKKERVERSLGSGVIVSSSGLVITNYHVIKGSDAITVILSDHREFNASIVLVDKKTDLALLRIESESNDVFSAITLADSNSLEVGDIVFAIGNPFGVGQAVTSGIVSALARTTIGVSDYQFFIQTDAAINPGNSGGALVGLDGKLVGVNTAIYSKSGGSHGIGFAIPANMVKTVIDGYLKTGRVVRPWLGASTQPITKELAESLGLSKSIGVLINEIYPEGPADKAKLRVGDIILSIGHKEVTDPHVLKFHMATNEIGQSYPITIVRKGKERTLSLKMIAPYEIPKRNERRLTGNHPFAGSVIANLSPFLADEMGLPIMERGVVVRKVSQRSIAKQFGVEIGDIIVEVNGRSVTNTKQAENILKMGENSGWKITVKRNGKLLKVRVAAQ